MTDSLTIAYLAIGAHRALREVPMPDTVCDRYEGELGFIDIVIGWEPLLTELCSKAVDTGDIQGVFDYEVSEPFGYHAAMCMLKQRGPLSDADGRVYAKTLVDEITAKEETPLEQAFREFEQALIEHEAAGAAIDAARTGYEHSTKYFIAARKQLWTLMPKQQTYVRGDRAFYAPSSTGAEINITKVAKS